MVLPGRSEINPGERLNLLVGDNGLGKSFVLEIIWWALSGKWAQYPAQPRTGTTESEIAFKFSEGDKAGTSLLSSQSQPDKGDIALADIISPTSDPSTAWEEEKPEDFVAKAAPFYELGELAFEQAKYTEARSYFRRSLK